VVEASLEPLPAGGGRTLEELVAELKELLRIPSISPSPGHGPDLRRAADWIGEAVAAAGGRAEVLETAGNPLVVGELRCGVPDAPNLLCYGHYDVQDPGPEALWSSPPFEPELRDGCLYARGAADDKGGLHALLAAAADLARAGELPCDVTLLADGEEEVGGDSALRWLAASERSFAAAIVFDATMAAPGRPQLTIGLRGLAAGHIAVSTSAADLHSGVFGGAALNAAHLLAEALATVTAERGWLPAELRAGADDPDPEEVESWAENLPAPTALMSRAEVLPADPEVEGSFYERTFARPALDVLGLSAGSVGAANMAIPARAEAIVSLRLAAGQEVESSWSTLLGLLKEQMPPGAALEAEFLVGCPPWSASPHDPVMRRAREAIAAASGQRCALARHGGSIPLVAALGAAGIPVVLSGVALPDDGIHAADERIPLASYALAQRMARGLISTIGQRHEAEEKR
jgi:acetylornithine deacetylase/succinyl-diaminopimelate desuccinylase-like protein